MKKILVLGIGKMGSDYIKNLVEAGLAKQSQVVGVDINPEKFAAFRADKRYAEFTGVEMIQSDPFCPLSDFVDLSQFDRVFLCTNTPSHQRLLVELMGGGIKKIFVEKPLTMTLEEANETRKIKMQTGARIFTAFLMNFSNGLAALIDRMKAEDLVVIQGHALWGKNRFGDTRPTPGDVQDEYVHPAGIYNTLIQSIMPEIEELHVAARLTYLNYFNVKAQEEACANDSSFPRNPNASAYVTQTVLVTGMQEVLLQINSSYVMHKQVRQVALTLASRSDPMTPVYAVEMNFDTKAGDVLDITRLSGNVVEETLCFPTNKLRAEISAFMHFADTGEIDTRLTDYFTARMSVKVTDAILRSDSLGGTKVQAIGAEDVAFRRAING